MNKNLLVALMLAAANASALDADDDAAQSQWSAPEAVPPAPGAPSGTPEGGYADPDRRRMDEARRKDVLDQLCRKLKLRRDFNLGEGNWPTATLGFTRRMEADIDGGLAILDEERLSVGWGKSYSEELGEGGPAGSIHAGATVAGRSMVIRRLGTFNTCEEVDRLLDLTDIKLALPFTGKRIREMGRGELWRVPLTLNIGYGASVSEALGDNAVLSLGLGKSKNGAASMTLWRMTDDKARFRFRIDFVEVKSKSLGISKTLPVVEWTRGGGGAMGLVDREIEKQLRKYTNLYLNFSRAKTDGKRIVMEFVIDPRKEEEAEAMAEALKGNLATLLKLAGRMSTSRTSEQETRDAYAGIQDDNMQVLGPAGYAALSEYRARSQSSAINVPLIVNRTVSEVWGADKVTKYTGDEGEFQFHNAARSPAVELFNVPFLGPIVKDIESRNVDVVTYAPKGAGHEAPFAVYIHNQAFLRLPPSAVRDGVEDANSVLRMAGVARTGRADATMQIPPPDLPTAPEGRPEQSDQKGWVSLTMVINQKAVADALAASQDELLRAWSRSIQPSDRPMAEWLVQNGRLENGRLVYDQARAARELGWEEGRDHQGWLANMARRAAGLAGDVAEAAAAPTYPERAEKLAKAFSQESRSGMSHVEVFRVLIQFVDPLDLSGDFIAAVDGTTRRAAKIQSHYVLKKGRAEVSRLGEAGAVRGRFVDGSILTD